MMRLRHIVWATAPAMLAVFSMLAPGLCAAAPAPAKRRVAKSRGHAVVSHPAKRPAVRRKITHRAVLRRVRYRPVRRYVRYRRPFGPSPNRIDQIQQALARSGFYTGDPSGRLDSQTVDAMKSFQQAHGISPTGKIDATTLQDLGLGSDIAGLAPPRPVVAKQGSGSSE
jgi:hypothetical protein